MLPPRSRHICLSPYLAGPNLKIREQAAADGKTFDDIVREQEERGLPFKFAERTIMKKKQRPLMKR